MITSDCCKWVVACVCVSVLWLRHVCVWTKHKISKRHFRFEEFLVKNKHSQHLICNVISLWQKLWFQVEIRKKSDVAQLTWGHNFRDFNAVHINTVTSLLPDREILTARHAQNYLVSKHNEQIPNVLYNITHLKILNFISYFNLYLYLSDGSSNCQLGPILAHGYQLPRLEGHIEVGVLQEAEHPEFIRLEGQSTFGFVIIKVQDSRYFPMLVLRNASDVTKQKIVAVLLRHNQRHSTYDIIPPTFYSRHTSMIPSIYDIIPPSYHLWHHTSAIPSKTSHQCYPIYDIIPVLSHLWHHTSVIPSCNLRFFEEWNVARQPKWHTNRGLLVYRRFGRWWPFCTVPGLHSGGVGSGRGLSHRCFGGVSNMGEGSVDDLCKEIIVTKWLSLTHETSNLIHKIYYTLTKAIYDRVTNTATRISWAQKSKLFVGKNNRFK